jgi:predicted nucleic acid-binding protein
VVTTGSNIRRAWDACNWISLIAEDEIHRADVCHCILDDAARGTGVILTSAFTLAEVMKARGTPRLTENQELTIVRFFEHSYILVHDVTRSVAEAARRLSREHGLKPPDAVHLATALLGNADVFETWNMNDFGHLNGLVPVAIREPTWEGNLPMNLDT